MAALIARINATPFVEKSEDLREKILRLLRNCIVFKEGMLANMAEICSAIGKCLADPSSTIKNVSILVYSCLAS
jgi:hypothetical protein